MQYDKATNNTIISSNLNIVFVFKIKANFWDSFLIYVM